MHGLEAGFQRGMLKSSKSELVACVQDRSVHSSRVHRKVAEHWSNCNREAGAHSEIVERALHQDRYICSEMCLP